MASAGCYSLFLLLGAREKGVLFRATYPPVPTHGSDRRSVSEKKTPNVDSPQEKSFVDIMYAKCRPSLEFFFSRASTERSSKKTEVARPKSKHPKNLLEEVSSLNGNTHGKIFKHI